MDHQLEKNWRAYSWNYHMFDIQKHSVHIFLISLYQKLYFRFNTKELGIFWPLYFLFIYAEFPIRILSDDGRSAAERGFR